MSESDFFTLLLHEAKRRGLVPPKTQFGPKSKFWYHACINFILNIVYSSSKKDDYIKNYWSTIFNTVSAPDKTEPYTEWDILLHELVHVQQYARWKILFPYLYLWPLSQGILLLFTCWLPILWASGWTLALWISAWIVLAGLHFIPQLPDPWRVWWELEAYTVSLFLYYKRYGKITSSYIDHIESQFTSMAYYKMAIRKQWVMIKLIDIAKEIVENKCKVKDNPLVVLALELRSKYVIG